MFGRGIGIFGVCVRMNRMEGGMSAREEVIHVYDVGIEWGSTMVEAGYSHDNHGTQWKI